MARPQKAISKTRVFKLACIGLTVGEIAIVEECDRSTLQRRFAAVIKDGHDRRNASLRRKQFEVAMGGNVSMLIWLGKQYLDQRDRTEVSGGEETLTRILGAFSKQAGPTKDNA